MDVCRSMDVCADIMDQWMCEWISGIDGCVCRYRGSMDVCVDIRDQWMCVDIMDQWMCV